MSVVIAGGGLMGLCAAFHLRRADAGVRVTVLERARVGAAASGASAAGVRVMGRDPAERRLALESLRRWLDLDRELEGETRYRRGGGFRAALDEEAWRAARGWAAEQRADGVPVEALDAAAARRLVPGVAPGCLGAAYCAIDGQAGAPETVQAFATAARRLGARVEEGVGARALVVERGRVVGVVRTDGVRERCDVAIVAAGVWSAPLLAALGIHLPLATRPLQMLLTAPAPRALAPVVGCFDRKLSLKQLDDGAYLIGGGWPARVVDEAANRWEVLDASVRGSLEVARTVYPALAGGPLARSWAGLEAFTPDELPVLGPVPGVDGLLVAAGFSGHGFALVPAVGDVLARSALGRDALADLWRGLGFGRAALAVPA
ncbi:MAG TPA: FAD-binding oxidoreductase [Methylomirabilota bacterium]|nr:FAD-binding oxidoreductase [Methylomirabilota bacterium]